MSTATDAVAPLFAALGDSTRLRLVSRLSGAGALSISQLTREEHISRQAITRHLQVLEDAGLATSARHGRETLWRLEPGGIGVAQTHLENLSRQWDTALERLRAIVED